MQPTDSQQASASYDAQYEELYGTSGQQSQPSQMGQYPEMPPAQTQPFSQSTGSTYTGGEKKGMSTGMIILLVVGILVIVGVLITVVLAGVLFTWTSSLASTDEGVTILHFTLEDGRNTDDTHGCFFLIRAGKGVDLDPARHSFYVAEKGYSPKKLDFSERQYIGGQPAGGDRNVTFDWTVGGDLWSDQEYLGFDMPMEDMGINIAEGKVYEVMIKNPQGEVIFKDTFVYSTQGYY